jgi:hypothetical protein
VQVINNKLPKIEIGAFLQIVLDELEWCSDENFDCEGCPKIKQCLKLWDSACSVRKYNYIKLERMITRFYDFAPSSPSVLALMLLTN